jgi:hypothetical protein
MNRLLFASMCLVLAACGGGEGGANMRPGENCLSCHDGSNREAPRFTVAGTVFSSNTAAASAGLSGVTVIITDANGAETPLTTTAVGNFYTTKTIAAPYKAAVVRNGTRTSMSATPNGGCSSCHATPPVGGAPGRLYAP